MSMNDIFNFLPKNQRENITKKLKPEYEKHVDQFCTPFLKKYNECRETKQKQLTKSYSNPYFIFNREITENDQELINYDTKLMCKSTYNELDECLNALFSSLNKGMDNSAKALNERLYLYLKYDYIKGMK